MNQTSGEPLYNDQENEQLVSRLWNQEKIATVASLIHSRLTFANEADLGQYQVEKGIGDVINAAHYIDKSPRNSQEEMEMFTEQIGWMPNGLISFRNKNNNNSCYFYVPSSRDLIFYDEKTEKSKIITGAVENSILRVILQAQEDLAKTLKISN